MGKLRGSNLRSPDVKSSLVMSFVWWSRYLLLRDIPRRFQLTSLIPKLSRLNYATTSSESFVDILKKKLTNSLQPAYLEVINESDQHNVPKESASHIRVIIVSPLFNDKRLVQRHRLVNDVLQEELKGAIHALSIQAVSTTEMKDHVEKQESPPCRGGSKR